jgi:hypothetical protein
MQREPISVSIRKILHRDITKSICSWQPVVRNGWVIKFSVYKTNILLSFTSINTMQTIIRYYNDEDVACEFINFVCHKDPAQKLML